MTSTNRNKVDHETINKINDNIDKDLNSFENVYLDRSEKIKELTNNGIRYNQELIGKYNKQFYKKYNNVSDKNQDIMNKNRLIMLNNREAIRKANMIKLLKMLLFWAIILTVLNFLRISKTISNKIFAIISIVSFISVFIYFLYTTQRGNTKNVTDKIAALSDATARGFAKAAAINLIPKSIMNPYSCPDGCELDIPHRDRLGDYNGQQCDSDYVEPGLKPDGKKPCKFKPLGRCIGYKPGKSLGKCGPLLQFSSYNTKFDVSMDPSKTGLPYKYIKKMPNVYPKSKLDNMTVSDQNVKGIDTDKALCYTCKSVNSNDSIKTNIPCKYMIGYSREEGTEPKLINIKDCR
jgi:hypothetical protein